MRNDALMKYRL